MTEANGHGVDISVSIVNWHTREDLLECLGSFVPPEARRQPEGSSFAVNGLTCEVIVVDKRERLLEFLDREVVDELMHQMRKPVSYTHLRAHATPEQLVCRLLLEKNNTQQQ